MRPDGRSAPTLLPAACVLVLALPGAAPAQPAAPQEVLITAPRAASAAPWASVAGGQPLARRRAAATDTAALLEGLPGVSLYGAGGVSGLPALHGLADDRVRTQVDGMDLVASCPNHMNPALSYIDPARVGRVTVYPGVAPVSAGGDSIGGAIQVDAEPPAFGSTEQAVAGGRAAAFVRSNGRARGGSVSATWGSERVAVSAGASAGRSANLKAARAFKPAAPGTEGGAPIPGDEIASSAFDSRNGHLGLALREGAHLLQLDLGAQQVAFEGFPNQRMDMTSNRSTQLNLRYTARFDGAEILLRGHRQTVRHRMDMGPDRYRYGFGMPMETESTTRGAALQATLDIAEGQRLRIGAEGQTYTLYDGWPAVGGTMGPNVFWNIDEGRRDKAGAYVEWEAQIDGWQLNAGVRADRVVSDAGPVQGYDNGLGAIWGNEAMAFNARDRRRSTSHRDAALLLRRESEGAWLEAGVARKTRSPNLYERYPWSTQAMAALMNNFVGDGNGYVGNPDLRPEVAHTLALNAGWGDAQRDEPSLRAGLHATRVRDFIGARRCDVGQCSAANASVRDAFVLLQYANHDARLYGMDLSGRAPLAGAVASFALAVQRGSRVDDGDPLYHQMPPQLKLGLQRHAAGWDLQGDWVLVAAKDRVSRVRNEIRTPGHALLNLKASYAFASARLDLGIDNVFDRAYAPPLGGAYVGQGPSMTTGGIPWGVPVPGAGRSVNVAFSLEY